MTVDEQLVPFRGSIWMPRKRNKRRVFLEQLGKALVAPFIKRRERLPRTDASAAVVKAYSEG